MHVAFGPTIYYVGCVSRLEKARMKSADKRVPAGGVIVIGSLSSETEARLTKAVPGKLAKISDSPPTHVLETTTDDLRKFSERINNMVGNEGVVAPLLLDQDGNRLFPTGHLQVRFREALSDDVLVRFAKRHQLDLAQRNTWAAQQAEFAVRRDDTRYFPDIAAQVSRDKQVAQAWPDVRAAFRRATA